MKRAIIIKAASIVTLGAILSACTEQSIARRDTVSSFSPNTQSSNIAVQSVNPWPHHIYHRGQVFPGERSASAYESYRTGASADAGGGSGSVENSSAEPTSGGGAAVE
jgi:hypothetical protein